MQITDGYDFTIIPVTVARNGSTIEGLTQDVSLDYGNVTYEFIYNGTTWQVTATTGARGPTGPTGIIGPTGNAGSVTLTNDITTNADRYLLFATTTGALSAAYIADSKLSFNPSDGILSAVDFNSLSDQQYKTDVKNITTGIEVINQVRPVSFRWKDNGKTSYGVIAQEIERILPDLVDSNHLGKTVGYLKLIPFLVQSIQELQQEIEKLKKK